MRFILAGLLLLLVPAISFAQPSGEVESIGFNGSYRPNCWTPMVVRLKPDSTDSANYEIEVYQHDLDGDRPIYTRPIVLNGSAQASSQRFWMYFLPEPTENGLPDQNLHELQRKLQVFLCKPGNPPKPVAQLPLTSTLQSVDPNATHTRQSKLILAVSAKGSKPTLNSNSYNTAFGVLEDVEVIGVRPQDLPEDPIGYEAVDAVIWLDGNPADLAGGSLDSFAALKDYVRFGGHLVICQSTANWQEDLGFGDLLPVDVSGIANKTDFEPLQSMATPRGGDDPFRSAAESWMHAAGPFQMARSIERPGAVIEKWIDWKQDGSLNDATPYLARKSFGMGQVTWVAQQLSTEAAPMNPTGWPYVWDKVMGWKNKSYVLSARNDNDVDKSALKSRLEPYSQAAVSDLGAPLVKGLDLTSKANWLILLAIFFFVAYWLVAGPGSYLYLVTKKRQGMSWFVFGIAALGATGLTVLVVQIVLRGPPEVRHISFVRVASGQPGIVHTRFGLYIPRDGDQTINLADSSGSSVSYLSPFAEHPQQLGDVSEFPSPTDYYVPVRDLKTEAQPEITVAYRSSSKKFQARWVGDWTNRIVGSVRLNPDDSSLHLTGTLTNATGVDLSDIFLAYNGGGDIDWMIYFPKWAKGQTFDITRDFSKPRFAGRTAPQMAVPGENKIICDEIAATTTAHGWSNLWHDHFRHSSTIEDANNVDGDPNFLFPLLSVFDRVPPIARTLNKSVYIQTAYNDDRVELFNRGARQLNRSSSIASGQLVILASAHGPLPIPLKVDDQPMAGDGTNFYQFLLPIDRGKNDAPATRPAAK